MFVRKIKNISKASIPVQISKVTTIYLDPGKEMANQTILNLEEIKQFVKLSYDLTEFPVLGKERQYLKS